MDNMTNIPDNGQVDQETLASFKEKILNDIETKGINEILVDTILSIFAMEAYIRNVSSVTNTLTDLLADKAIIDREEFRTNLRDNLQRTKEQLDQLMESLDKEDAARASLKNAQ
jgi:hypothetical protein